MEGCNTCPWKMKNKIKKKHCLAKKHNFLSNLKTNKYKVKINEIDKYKDIIQPYYNNHKKKIDDFTVCVMWKKNEKIINKISVPSTITLEKPHLFEPSMVALPIDISVSPVDFLDTFDRNIKDEVDEIVIIIISDLRDKTFSHHMAQPRSMLCRKLEKTFIEEHFGYFKYNLLPSCF